MLFGFVCYGVLIGIKSSIMGYNTFITLLIAVITSLFVFGFILFLLKIEEEDKDVLKGINFLKGIIKRK